MRVWGLFHDCQYVFCVFYFFGGYGYGKYENQQIKQFLAGCVWLFAAAQQIEINKYDPENKVKTLKVKSGNGEPPEASE